LIPIGTQLEPRHAGDPVVTVCGIEGDRYNLQPVPFGRPVFGLDYDGLAAAYECAAFTISITHESESDQWRKLSAERYAGHLAIARDREREKAALPSPNEFFAAQQAAAEAGKRKRR
jgi:hypothetical protein